MYKPTECLKAAYAERAAKFQTPPSEQHREAFHDLAFLAGWLIEGTAYEKKEARTTLAKLIGRGRCLLNAADLAKRETVAAVCREPQQAQGVAA